MLLGWQKRALGFPAPLCKLLTICILFYPVIESYLHRQAGSHTEAGHCWEAIAVGQNWI